jgi:hypothetical protein
MAVLACSADWHMINRARYKGNDVFDIDIGGTGEAYAAGGTVVTFGCSFTDVESAHHMPVAAIGEDLEKAFFPTWIPSA